MHRTPRDAAPAPGRGVREEMEKGPLDPGSEARGKDGGALKRPGSAVEGLAFFIFEQCRLATFGSRRYERTYEQGQSLFIYPRYGFFFAQQWTENLELEGSRLGGEERKALRLLSYIRY